MAVLMLMLTVALSGCLVGKLLFPEVPHGPEALREGHVALGAWLGAWPSDGAPLIDRFEGMTDSKLDIVDVFLDWSTPFVNVSHTVEHVARHGTVPMLTWEPHGITTRDILDGGRTVTLRDGEVTTIGAYLDDFAADACRKIRQIEAPILLRPLHEMNGNWNAWGVGWQDADGNQPNNDASFQEAWKRVHGAFARHCTPGQDILFVFAINHFSVGPDTSFMGMYPGDAYVDYVGIDGYNWGAHARWGWQNFDALFAAPYCAVVNVSQRPVLVAEYGSTAQGGNKAQWLDDTFRAVAERYPRIRGLVYLNEDKFESEIDGRMDWSLQSSSAALNAYKQWADRLEETRLNQTYQPPPLSEVGPACGGQPVQRPLTDPRGADWQGRVPPNDDGNTTRNQSGENQT